MLKQSLAECTSYYSDTSTAALYAVLELYMTLVDMKLSFMSSAWNAQNGADWIIIGI